MFHHFTLKIFRRGGGGDCQKIKTLPVPVYFEFDKQNSSVTLPSSNYNPMFEGWAGNTECEDAEEE
jgi:hypothetical protein